MAVIASTTLAGTNGTVAVTKTTLGSSDTMTYNAAENPIALFYNPTVGSLTVLIDGDGGTTISPAGYGGTVSVASGYSVVCAAGTMKAIKLRTIDAFLQGTITLSGASTLEAFILTNPV